MRLHVGLDRVVLFTILWAWNTCHISFIHVRVEWKWAESRPALRCLLGSKVLRLSPYVIFVCLAQRVEIDIRWLIFDFQLWTLSLPLHVNLTLLLVRNRLYWLLFSVSVRIVSKIEFLYLMKPLDGRSFLALVLESLIHVFPFNSRLEIILFGRSHAPLAFFFGIFKTRGLFE